jgi:hypothetical protein
MDKRKSVKIGRGRAAVNGYETHQPLQNGGRREVGLSRKPEDVFIPLAPASFATEEGERRMAFAFPPRKGEGFFYGRLSSPRKKLKPPPHEG